jgi:hypothetical protein
MHTYMYYSMLIELKQTHLSADTPVGEYKYARRMDILNYLVPTHLYIEICFSADTFLFMLGREGKRDCLVGFQYSRAH